MCAGIGMHLWFECMAACYMRRNLEGMWLAAGGGAACPTGAGVVVVRTCKCPYSKPPSHHPAITPLIKSATPLRAPCPQDLSMDYVDTGHAGGTLGGMSQVRLCFVCCLPG